MCGELAALQEVQRDGLGQRRRLAVGQAAQGRQGLHQRARRDHVAQPDSGEERLVEGAHVDHPLAAIQALQRRQGRALVAELRGVIVFHDPGAGLPRPGDQLQAPAHRHRHAQGELVRRGHESGAGIRRALHAGLDDQARAVDRYEAGVGARRVQSLAGLQVAGVLEPHLVPVPQQQPHRQVHGVLGAGGDDHLLGRADHASRGAHIVGDRAAQSRVARRLGIAEVLRAQRAQRPARGNRPGVQRAGVHECAPVGEHLRRGRLGPNWDVGQLQRPGRQPRRRGRLRGATGGLQVEHARQVVRDVGARPGASLGIAFGQQLVIGRHHRGPRHAQAHREVAAGREPAAGLEGARMDGAAHLVIDLADHGPPRLRRGPGIDVGPTHGAPRWTVHSAQSGPI